MASDEPSERCLYYILTFELIPSTDNVFILERATYLAFGG